MLTVEAGDFELLSRRLLMVAEPDTKLNVFASCEAVSGHGMRGIHVLHDVATSLDRRHKDVLQRVGQHADAAKFAAASFQETEQAVATPIRKIGSHFSGTL